MTDWSQLNHAYGSAENVPFLLDRLEPDPAAECWEELWSHLCDEGTVYPASFAALPRLTETAEAWAPEDRVLVLALAGAILAGARTCGEGERIGKRYAAEIRTLARLTDECLCSPSLSYPPDDYVQLLQASLAFEGIPVWAEHLEELSGEEYQVGCPGCSVELFIAMGEYGFFAAADDYTAGDVKRTPLVPTDPGELDGLAARLYATARNAGQDKVANALTYLFGTATCTECDTAFSVADGVVAAHGT